MCSCQIKTNLFLCYKGVKFCFKFLIPTMSCLNTGIGIRKWHRVLTFFGNKCENVIQTKTHSTESKRKWFKEVKSSDYIVEICGTINSLFSTMFSFK